MLRIPHSLLFMAALLATLPVAIQAQTPRPTVIPVPAIPSSSGSDEQDDGADDNDPVPDISPDTATPPADLSTADAEKRAKEFAKLRGTKQDPDFKKAVDATYPLSPEQIEELGQVEDSIDRAVAARKPPAMSTTTLHATTRPGVAPPRVLLADDYVTSLSFLDSTGAPWPITRAIAGNSGMFMVEVPPTPGNVVILAPLRKYAASNLLVMLKGSSVPILVALENNRQSAYFNVNLVLDQPGPLALKEVVRPPADPIDDAYMRAILDGAGGVTAGIRQVRITGSPDSTAFMAASKFYLRTPHTLIFPNNNTASLRSGGIRVYELPVTPLITVADENGRPLDLRPSDETLLEGALASRASDRIPVSSSKVSP